MEHGIPYKNESTKSGSKLFNRQFISNIIHENIEQVAVTVTSLLLSASMLFWYVGLSNQTKNTRPNDIVISTDTNIPSISVSVNDGESTSNTSITLPAGSAIVSPSSTASSATTLISSSTTNQSTSSTNSLTSISSSSIASSTTASLPNSSSNTQSSTTSSSLNEATSLSTNTTTSSSTTHTEPILSDSSNLLPSQALYTTLGDICINKPSYCYNYCPSVMNLGSSYYMYYCTNLTENLIQDYIGVRTIEQYLEGFTISNERIVLAPTEGSWDSANVCDPSVVRGAFTYKNTNYKYLMAYLGCSSQNSQQNSIGLAVSNYPDKDFIKIGNNPIIKYNYDPNHVNDFQWGVGQPSIINLGQNKIALFYTVGDWNRTYTKLNIYDMSNIDHPILLSSKEVSNKGVGHNIHNADFAIDDNCLYMICDGDSYSGVNLNIIPDTSKVYKCVIDNDLEQIDSVNWEICDTINAYEKNHNCGFVRSINGVKLTDCVAITSAEEQNTFMDSLITYNIRFIQAYT